jgi:hypothetical protein
MERYAHGAGVVTYLARYLRGGPLKNARLVAWERDRITFTLAWEGDATRNASQALISYGWKAGFRRRASCDRTPTLTCLRKAVPTTCFDDTGRLVYVHQSRGRRKRSSIACGERYGGQWIENLQILHETHGGRMRSANAARAYATAGLRWSLAGHMQSRRTKISSCGCGASYCPRASLSTQCAWDRSRQHA